MNFELIGPKRLTPVAKDDDEVMEDEGEKLKKKDRESPRSAYHSARTNAKRATCSRGLK